MTKNKYCPNCEGVELVIVRFRYTEDGQSIPDGVERFMCLGCGYQKIKTKWWRIV